MIRLDSLDVTLDAGPLPTVNLDALTYHEATAGPTGETHAGWTIRDTGLHGFNGMKVTDAGSVSLRLTAQAMGDAYSDGISLDTLPQLCDRLTATGILDVTPDHLLAGVVRRGDPFADVPRDGLDVAGALRLIGRTSGDGTEVKGRGEKVTLYHKLPDREGRLRTYPKDHQLSTAKHKTFREAYPVAIARVQGHHRFEVESQTYHASRRIARLPSGTPTLADLLTSTRTPVADALDGLLSTWTGRRRALLSLPSLPESLDVMLSRPPSNAREDAFALLATLYADLCGGDYTAAQAAVRTRYGAKHAHRLFGLLAAACESYGRPASAGDAHAEAYDVLSAVAARVREREAG